MHTWFYGAVQYDRIAEEGKVENIVENYLIDALSFTEAESRLIEEIRPFVSGELTVKKIRRAKINELFYNDGSDKWYKAKVMFITLDESKGVEKKTAVTMLVQADGVKDACERLTAGMQGTMADYELAGMVETDILDIFKYEVSETE